MGASRESYKISSRWKWGGKTFWKKLISVDTLIVNAILHKYDRNLFIKDNFTQPFNQLIGCKLFGHNFRKDYDPVEYICLKCWKRMYEQDYNLFIRKQKIQRIKNKI